MTKFGMVSHMGRRVFLGQPRHCICTNASRGLPATHLEFLVFCGNACCQVGKIVLSTGTQIVNLNLVKITASRNTWARAAKLKGDQIFTGGLGIITVPTIP